MHRDQAAGGFAEALVVGGGSRRLERIAALVDWDAVSGLVAPIHGSRRGRPSYAPLAMLKVALLQAWYGLGDPAMEEALGDRLSFRRFAGFALDERVPDHATICRFRLQLVKHGLAEAVFVEVNRQIAAHGLILKQGTLIDATLIAAQVAEPPRQKGGGRSAADPDARWAKKGSKAYFGYKLHVAVDQGTGMVRAARLTPANVADVDVGHALVCGDERAVFADKAYVGPRMRARLRQGGPQGPIKDRVQRRAARGRPLRRSEVRWNRLIGRIRGRVEGVFGALKRSCGMARCRFMGLARNSAATLLTLTAWNLARAADQAA